MKPSSPLLRLTPGAAVTTLTRMIDVAASYGFYLLVSRTLGVQKFGLFALGISMTSLLATLCRLGLDHGALRFVALYRAGGSEHRVRFVVRVLQYAILTSSLVCMVAACALVVLLENSVYAAAWSGPRRWLLLTLPFMALGPALIAVLRGARHVSIAACIEGLCQPLSCLAIAVVAVVLQSEAGIAFAFLASWAIACAFARNRVMALVKMKTQVPRTTDSDAKRAEIVPFSLMILGVSMTMMLASSVDTMVLAYFRGQSDVGRYAAAQKAALALSVIPSAVGLTFAPLYPEYLSEGEGDRFGHLLRTITRWVVMMNTPLLLIMLICPQAILGMFGKDFSTGAREILMILTVSQWVFAAAAPSNLLLLMAGHQRLLAWNALGRLLMSLLLLWLLTPGWGAVGAAAASACATIITRLWVLAEVHWKTRVFPWDVRMIPIAWAATASGLCLYALTPHVPAGVAILCGVALYIAVLGGWGFDREDRDAWRAIRHAAASPFETMWR